MLIAEHALRALPADFALLRMTAFAALISDLPPRLVAEKPQPRTRLCVLRRSAENIARN
jgi:hypothetical protein